MDAQTTIAKRVALELRSGMLVNLGIGIPTLIANYVPADLKVFFQSENGLIGTGSIPEQGMEHPLLTDAGGRPISALPGACTSDSAMSFGLIRGGQRDVSLQLRQYVLIDSDRPVVIRAAMHDAMSDGHRLNPHIVPQPSTRHRQRCGDVADGFIFITAVDQHGAVGPGGAQPRPASDAIYLALDLALQAAVLRDPKHLEFDAR